MCFHKIKRRLESCSKFNLTCSEVSVIWSWLLGKNLPTIQEMRVKCGFFLMYKHEWRFFCVCVCVNETVLPLFPPLCIRFYGFLIKCTFFITKITCSCCSHWAVSSLSPWQVLLHSCWLVTLFVAFLFLDLHILRVGLSRLLPQELAEKRDILVGNIIAIFYV